MGGGEPKSTPTPTPTPTDREELMELLKQVSSNSLDVGISKEPSGTKSMDRGYEQVKGEGRIYDQEGLAAVVDALSRIGIFDMAQPPEFLGRRHQPIDYILPMYPPNTMPEDIRVAF